MLLRYQGKWNSDRSRVKVIEKSRRIGISWGDAAESALDAAQAKGCNTWYLGYNKDMAEQYIEDVAFWAKHYNLAASSIEETVLENEDEDILVFRVRFASGFKVSALSSRPSNLRAKKGKIVIDEAAFHPDLPELLKAAMAILAWGGQVRVISTHNGIDNPFNQLIKDIRDGKLDYSLHTVTLDDAIADGLYQRICLINGEVWTKEKEIEWRSQLYKDYGVGADEELGCKPLDVKTDGLFNRSWFEVVDRVPSDGITVRFWDLAATESDIKNACYTAGVKMRKVGDIYYVVDVIAVQLSPAKTDELIKATAQQDGKACAQRWELEGGSAGKRDAVHLATLLDGYDAAPVRPQGDKVLRAKPFATQAAAGNVKLLRNDDWNDRFLNWLQGFPTGSKDAADAASGAYNYLVSAITGKGGWF